MCICGIAAGLVLRGKGDGRELGLDDNAPMKQEIDERAALEIVRDRACINCAIQEAALGFP